MALSSGSRVEERELDCMSGGGGGGVQVMTGKPTESADLSSQKLTHPEPTVREPMWV